MYSSPRKITALVFALLLALAACSSHKGEAEKMLADIDAAIAGAAPDAAKYSPDDLVEVQKNAAALRASFEAKEYKSVMKQAPSVLAAAQALGPTATVKKTQEMRKLQAQWATLAAEIPDQINVVQSRMDYLGKPANRKLATGVDLDTARTSLQDVHALWVGAQQAYAGNRFEEALADGNGAKGKLQALADSMKVDFSEPAAVQDTSVNH
jgi:hypothetical protein